MLAEDGVGLHCPRNFWVSTGSGSWEHPQKPPVYSPREMGHQVTDSREGAFPLDPWNAQSVGMLVKVPSQLGLGALSLFLPSSHQGSPDPSEGRRGPGDMTHFIEQGLGSADAHPQVLALERPRSRVAPASRRVLESHVLLRTSTGVSAWAGGEAEAVIGVLTDGRSQGWAQEMARGAPRAGKKRSDSNY